MDVKIFGISYRLISVYFPDSTYPDADVQKVYDELSEIVEEAKKKHIRVMVAGDFNARVGQGEDAEVHSSAGSYGYGNQNARGQWLLTWSSTHSLRLSNTMFRKPDSKLVTHLGTQG